MTDGRIRVPPNLVEVTDDDLGRRVNVTFTDAAAPSVGRLLAVLLGQPRPSRAELVWVALGRRLGVLPRRP